jgi:hypothetical protein
MITVCHDADVVERDRIQTFDPFQNSEPSWRTRVYYQLPPETQTTVVRLTPSQEYKKMAIRVIAEASAPVRMFKRGAVSSKQDYVDVMNALRDMKAGQAIIVDMDLKAWEVVKKPETTFANNLRRYFDAKGLQITAYQSGPGQITVRKATALDKVTPRGAAKGKK